MTNLTFAIEFDVSIQLFPELKDEIRLFHILFLGETPIFVMFFIYISVYYQKLMNSITQTHGLEPNAVALPAGLVASTRAFGAWDPGFDSRMESIERTTLVRIPP